MVVVAEEGDEGEKRYSLPPPLLRRHTIDTKSPSKNERSNSLNKNIKGRQVARSASGDSWTNVLKHSDATNGFHPLGQTLHLENGATNCPGSHLVSTDNSSNQGSQKDSRQGQKQYSVYRGPPRVAWDAESNNEDLEIEGSPAVIKTTKRKLTVRPKSCITPLVSDASKEIKDSNDAHELPESSSKDPLEQEERQRLEDTDPRALYPDSQETPQVKETPVTSNEILKRIASKVCRSQSSPDIYGNAQKHSTFKTQSYEEDEDDKHIVSFEPYDGLLIQRATFFSPESKQSTTSGSCDDEDESKEVEKSAKLLGYKPKNGFYFLPFSKLFTKPSKTPKSLSRRSSRTSLADTELEVENSLQQFSESERDFIKRTRSALKQRISSANKKRSSSANKKKIQLSIVVNTKPESDESVPCSDREDSELFQRPKSTPVSDINKKKQKIKKAKNRERSVPSELMQSRIVAKTEKKAQKMAKVERKQPKVVKRVKKKEIPTMMSEISPVPSDIEDEYYNTSDKNRPLYEHEVSGAFRNSRFDGDNYNTDDDDSLPARGGLLQTIISDANSYKPVSRTWKGNRMHVEVRIRTQHQKNSSSEEEEEEEEEEKGETQIQEDKRKFFERRRGRFHRQDRIEGLSSSASPAESKTIGGGPRGMGGLLLPTPQRQLSKNASHIPTASVLRAREREKLRRILEVCSAKVEESRNIMRRLASNGIWVSLDTLQRGLMSPTEYRVYQDHLKSLEIKDQRKHPPQKAISSPFPYRRDSGT